MAATRFRAAAAGMLMLAAASLACAEGFSLSPLRVSIGPREASSSVIAENTGDAPIVIQVRTLAWSQRDGLDQREETRDLIVNPPIFKLSPGEQQLVRIASRLAPPRDDERAYRAVFTEVPPRESLQGQAGFRVALAMDIPVFIESVAAAAPRAMVWRAERTSMGIRIRAENPGNVHFRIVDVQFVAEGTPFHKQAFVVVLPRSWREFDLPAPPPAAKSLQISADGSDGQKVVIDLPLAPSRTLSQSRA